MSRRDRVLSWIEPEDNPRGTIYGTIAAGLVIAAEDPAGETFVRVLVATAVAVASYWLAHGYAHWVGERLRDGPGPARRWPLRGLGHALGHEWPIIEGGAVPMAALLIAGIAGASLATAVAASLWAAAAALAVFEVVGGLRRQVRLPHLVANAATGVVLGLALFGVKGLLH